jgi:hypothetical protein
MVVSLGPGLGTGYNALCPRSVWTGGAVLLVGRTLEAFETLRYKWYVRLHCGLRR